jgi:hypothetical protein
MFQSVLLVRPERDYTGPKRLDTDLTDGLEHFFKNQIYGL